MKNFIAYSKKIAHTFFPKGTANPHTQWILLLRGFWLVAFVLAVFSFYLFNQIKTDQVFQTSAIAPTTPLVIQQMILQRVTDAFDAKSLRSQQLQKEPFAYPDPSMK
jgi:small-conductance mechanosensitive channel